MSIFCHSHLKMQSKLTKARTNERTNHFNNNKKAKVLNMVMLVVCCHVNNMITDLIGMQTLKFVLLKVEIKYAKTNTNKTIVRFLLYTITNFNTILWKHVYVPLKHSFRMHTAFNIQRKIIFFNLMHHKK